MNNILLINPFGIGDVLFTTPVVGNLRRMYPHARIVYIGNRRTAELLSRNPKIDQVLVYERDEFYAAYQRNVFLFVQKWADFIREIKGGRFDAVFDFSLNCTFGFIGWLCGIPKRIGYDYRGRGYFLTHKFFLEGYEGRHVIEYYLDLLRHEGIAVVDTRMELLLSVEDKEWARQWLGARGIDFNKPLFAMVPGGGASWGAQAKNKRWPADKYADLADKIIADSGAAVILMGDAGEEQLCQEIVRLAHFPLYSAAGQTTLMQMAALLDRCRLAIVNDGGPLHVAVALGVKTVSIFGPVDAAVYGPYPPGGHGVAVKGLACQPCYRRFRQAQCGHLSCLRDLSVEDVYKHVGAIINRPQ